MADKSQSAQGGVAGASESTNAWKPDEPRRHVEELDRSYDARGN